MAASVWVLSVDLTTKTASFTSGLSDAAKAARGSFSDIKNDANDMSRGVGSSTGAMGGHMMEARHGIMLLGEEFGVHLPRALTSFIASIGPIGAAMEAAFPFLAIAVGATLLVKHLEKIREEAAAAAEASSKSLEKITDKSDSLRVSIAESKVKLDELLGKPDSGDLLALEIAKARVEADKLAESLRGDIEGTIKLMETTAHGSLMTGLLGTSGPGQAEDVAKGFRDALAKIPRDAKNYNERAAQAAVDTWNRAESELEKNHKDKAKQLAHGKSDLGNMLGGTDYTAANTGLQSLQEKMSAIRDNLALISADDAFKKQAQYVAASQAAEDSAFDAANRHQLEKNAWKLKGMKDQADIAQAIDQAALAEQSMQEQLARSGVSGITAVIAAKDKEVEAWVKASETMIAEDKRHADAMAALQGKSDPQSKSAENQAYAAKVAAWEKERALLESKPLEQKKIDDRMAEAAQQHANRLRAINSQYFGQLNREAASSATAVMTGQESIGKAARQMFLSMTSTMLEHFIEKKMLTLEDMIFSSAANKAQQVSAATLAGANMTASWAAAPWPIDSAAPAMGASAAGAAMAFAEGGIVPGTGNRDAVPAMLTPGEGVFPKKLMEQLTNAAQHGRMDGGKGDTHVHVSHSLTVHAIDSTGVRQMLEKHSEQFASSPGCKSGCVSKRV